MRRLGRLTRSMPLITGRRWSSYFSESRSCLAMPSPTTVASRRKPSAISTRAIASFVRDHGTSTRSLRAWLPLRMRVKRSAIGSVIDIASPTRLDETGDLPLARQIAQAEPAHAELAVERPRPAAQRTAVVLPDAELLTARRFHSETGLGHRSSSVAEREAERAQQQLRVVVRTRGRANGNGHALHLVDLVEIDLRENDLLADAQRVVAAAVERAVGKSLEVAHARQRDVHQPIEEL